MVMDQFTFGLPPALASGVSKVNAANAITRTGEKDENLLMTFSLVFSRIKRPAFISRLHTGVASKVIVATFCNLNWCAAHFSYVQFQ